MAEMLTDLLQNIYGRISQLGQEIQGLKSTLEDLNNNIEQKISSLNERILEFSKEINITQTIHIDALNDIGESMTGELETIQKGLAIDSFQKMINSLQNFEKLASDAVSYTHLTLPTILLV